MSDSPHEEPLAITHLLTDLEARILTEIAGGASDTEVALKLYIYEDAVRRHFYSAMKKIGVHNYAQATAWAKQHLTRKPDLLAQA